MTDVRVIHCSMQFSDTKSQHQHDADALYSYAAKRGALFVTGTEAGSSKSNNDLQQYLKAAALVYGFKMNAHKYGDWTAVASKLADVTSTGYDGPFIPGTTGLKASQGAHAPRGITWSTAKMTGVGTITIGSAHFLTDRSEKASGTSNQPLLDGIAKWGREKGKGRQLVIFNADVNENDKRQDVFKGGPFTTCWDELGKWPATHGVSKTRGTTIDVSASFNGDGRVSAKSARVLDDSDLQLFTDHFAIEVVYAIK